MSGVSRKNLQNQQPKNSKIMIKIFHEKIKTPKFYNLIFKSNPD